MKPVRFAALAWCLAAFSCAGFYYRKPADEVIALKAMPSAAFDSTLGAAGYGRLAVQNSTAIEAERRRLELAEGAWRLGARAFLPNVELGASSDERIAEYGPDTFAKGFSFSITQPLWDGGRLAAARAAEKAELSLARDELGRMERETAEVAIQAYRAAASARGRVLIRREAYAAAAAEREILAAELRLGLASSLELAELDLRLAEAELEIRSAELALAQAESALAEAAGVAAAPESYELPDPDRPRVALDAAADEALGAAARARSPELRALRYELARKAAEAKAAAFAWLPTASLKAGLQLSGRDFPLTRSGWSLGLSLDFAGPYFGASIGVSGGIERPGASTARTGASLRPLPDPAAPYASRRAALALNQAEDALEAASKRVARAAVSAASAYRNALRGVEVAKRSLELAEARRELVALRLALGLARRSELVKAGLERAGNELTLLDAATALLSAERALERLLDIEAGGLMDFVDKELYKYSSKAAAGIRGAP